MMHSNPQKILFRLDFGATIGLGHLARCSYLSRELISMGHETVLLYGSETDSRDPFKGISSMRKRFSECVRLSGREARVDQLAPALRNYIGIAKPAYTIIDHYQAGQHFLTDLRKVAPVVLVDDYERALSADLVINYGKNITDSPNQAGHASTELAGAKFSLVGASSEFKSVDSHEEFLDVIISVGGGKNGLLAEAIAGDVGGVLCGPAIGLLSRQKGFQQLNSDLFREARFRRDASLPAILQKSRRAIVSAGVSLLESVSHGRPTLALLTATNQVPGASSYSDFPHVVVVEDRRFFSSKSFKEWWLSFEDENLRAATNLTLRAKFDSYGPARVALSLGLSPHNRLSFRQMAERDLPILFSWRKEDSGSRGVKSQSQPSPADHLRWFGLANERGSIVRIAELSGVPVGQFRLDRRECDDGYTLSYSVDSLYRGRGFGKAIVREAVKSAGGVSKFFAVVHSANVASLRLLEGEGFERQADCGEGFMCLVRDNDV